MRPKNRFGQRFISLSDLCNYTVDVDLETHPPHAAFMEFLEREGLLAPVARVRFSPEILRRFAQIKEPNRDVFQPIEPDGPTLDAAIDLFQTLSENRWQNSLIYGESEHLLDVIADNHAPFIVTEFSAGTFTPWEDLRAPVYESQGSEIRSTARFSPSYYHYWQIFWLAAILRSGLIIHYSLDDDEIGDTLWRRDFGADVLSGRLHTSINIEARRHLNELRDYVAHFEMVGYFEAYSHHALQVHASGRDDETGRLSPAASRAYYRREREIACETLQRSELSADDLIEFIGKQSEWWDDSRRVGPPGVAEEYKRNISSSLRMHCRATGVSSRTVVGLVGNRGGYHRPILEVIFPDWTEEQRDLTIRSLKNWADQCLNSLPSPFPVNETDLGEFCDWLEDAGLHQYYWHFKRVVDTGIYDGPVERAATAAEAVGFANLCEMIANKALEDRGYTARGNTLGRKLNSLFGSNGPIDLNPYFGRFSKLTNTKKRSLAQRMAQIDRIRQGGAHAPVLRALLQMWVIRNEGSHLGLLRYDRAKIIKMIETMALASLMIWRAR